ncbi:MAG: pitrilysin family protein [Myxococcota bacterium]
MILAVLAAGCAPKIDPGPVAAEVAAAPVRLVARPVAAAPDVYFAAIVAAGSAYDPVGSEGIAALTLRATVDAGAGDRSAAEVRDALYPLGAAFDVVVDREWASIRLRCHRDHVAACTALFVDALVHPRFDDADVARLRDRSLEAVTDGMLADEETLGREVLDAALYEGHPYGHPPDGRSGVLPLLDAAAARAFHHRHYVRASMVVGIAGGFDDSAQAALAEALDAVPGLRPPELPLMQPAPVLGRSLVAVDTDTPVTGYWFGQPIALDRTDPDWAAIQVAITALGAHRQSFGRLFEALRGDRGLNYGDYAYVEPYIERGSAMPDQGVLRRQNRFAVWVRPTSLDNGPFALKLAVDEVERWVADGLTADEFDDVRSYLRSGLPVLAADPGRRLVYALDAVATGTPDPFDTLPAALDALTVEQVNAAIRAHVDPKNLAVVAVSGEAAALVTALTEQTATPIVYADGAADPSRAERDARVAGATLGIEADRVTVIDAEGVFR